MFDLQSILIYVGLAIASFVIAKYAETANSKKAVWLLVVLLSLVAGLRAVTVGIDTKTYDKIFNLISLGEVQSIYSIEKSFIYICAVLLKIWNNSNFLFFIFAFVSHGLILFRIWKDREHISFRWSVFSYYILLFSFSLNGMRQFIAVAIVFYATAFVKEGRYVKFLVSVLLACLFHTSAVVGLAYLFFEIAFARYFDVKRKRVILILISMGALFALSVVSNLLDLYSRYFEQQASSFGYMMIIKLALLLISTLIIPTPKDKGERYYYFSHRWNYFIGLLLNSLSYIFLYAGRIGLYFYAFEMIYIGYLFKAKNKTQWHLIFKLGYVALLLYYLYVTITSGAHGEMPYRFFWQS